jgi:hypothetical protein
MGFPGQAFLCWRGHLFHYINPNLLPWGCSKTEINAFLEYLRKIRDEGCPCGAPTLEVIDHYGDINDYRERPLIKVGTEKLRFLIKGAVDLQGNPLEAFQEQEVPLYYVADMVYKKVVHQDC